IELSINGCTVDTDVMLANGAQVEVRLEPGPNARPITVPAAVVHSIRAGGAGLVFPQLAAPEREARRPPRAQPPAARPAAARGAGGSGASGAAPLGEAGFAGRDSQTGANDSASTSFTRPASRPRASTQGCSSAKVAAGSPASRWRLNQSSSAGSPIASASSVT